MKNLIIFYPQTEQEFWQRAKDDAVLAIRETLQKEEECRIGLAGGQTPKHLYELLAEENLPWEYIKIVLIDERYVHSDNPESNLHMLRESLLKKISLPPKNFITFDTSLTQNSAVEEMSRRLRELSFGRKPLFDLLILGAGADGHIASLFESEPALHSEEFASCSEAKHAVVQERLTLTNLALNDSKRALLLLKGSEKLAVAQCLEGGSDTLPLTALRSLLEGTTVKVLAFLK